MRSLSTTHPRPRRSAAGVPHRPAGADRHPSLGAQPAGHPDGRKNWLFCWAEIGAEQVGLIQGLLVTCRLHGVNPHTYLVDVLQRVGQHPASRVIELTPRLWKKMFANNPLRSDVECGGKNVAL